MAKKLQHEATPPAHQEAGGTGERGNDGARIRQYQGSPPARECPPAMPLAEFEAVSGISRVEFAGFRAHVAVNGLKKQRTAAEWRRLFDEYAGM